MNYTIKEKSDLGETDCMKLSTKAELEETPSVVLCEAFRRTHFYDFYNFWSGWT